MLLGLVVCSCGSGKKASSTAAGQPGLKQVFSGDFAIGAALNSRQILSRDPGAAALIPAQFNAITPENIMKAEIIHPAWDRYDFSLADSIVDYGKKHGMQINGHTLIWHSQLPAFMRSMQSADSVRRFFTDHIRTIASRYNGSITSWDVVNEALNEDGSLRKSIFLDKLGEDYIVEAFRLAQQAAPKTELYYNDYNIEQPKKRAGAIALIKKIQAAGVRIDGVGIQGHWRSYRVPLQEIEQSIKEFSALGVKVMFTEVDLGVLPNPWDNDAADVNQKAEYSARMNPYPAAAPDSVLQQQANSYAALFDLFVKYRGAVSRVTFWGVNDGNSWLNNWPIPGRSNYPLLFDRQYKPKPAYYQVVETKTKNSPKPKAF